MVEVNRPNRQVRRRHGKSDVVDAIAAARAVISDQATVIPKTHDGSWKALRALQIVHRSAIKARTQALNQLHALIVTAPEPDPRPAARSWPGPRCSRSAGATARATATTSPRSPSSPLRELATRSPTSTTRSPASRPDDPPGQRPRPSAAGHLRRRPRHRRDAARQRRRQPRPTPQRGLLRRAARRQPDQGSVSGKTKRDRLNRGGDRQGNSALLAHRDHPHGQPTSRPRPTSNAAPPMACPRPKSSVPQALRRPRSLQRTTPRAPHLTVGASNGRYVRPTGRHAPGLPVCAPVVPM